MSNGPRYGQINHDYGLKLATTAPEDDGPIWMVNLMQYRDVAEYSDGRETTRSGRDADDEYLPAGPLAAVGAEIVYAAEVELQLLGEGKPWDRVGIVRYPTRQSFIDMQQRDDFKDKHQHKEAGMERTIVMGCLPMIPQPGEGLVSEGPAWSDVEFPPTSEDGECHVLHVIKWNEGGAETMEGYHDTAFHVASAHGARIAGWFQTEGTIIGDGRSWDQVRFNAFPSLAAFMAVVSDPSRQTAQADFREPAMADTYTMVCRPIINRLRESFAT